MTAACRGAASSPNPGYPTILGASSGAIAALFSRIPLPQSAVFAGFLGAITVDLSQLCATDPPADPNIGFQDCVDLTLPQFPVPFAAASAKFVALFKRFLWPLACQCADNLAPIAPGAPAFPAVPPMLNPPILPTPVTPPCYSANTHVLSSTFQTQVGSTQFNFIDTQLLAPFSKVTVTGNVPGFNTAYVIGSPLPPTITYDITNATSSALDHTMSVNCNAYNSTGGFIASGTGASTYSGFSQHGSFTFPAGTASIQIAASYNSVAFPFNQFDVALNVQCAGFGVNPVIPCCPPDPNVAFQLEYLRQMVTLIQRQLVPFATILSTVHGPLTGAGSFAVQGLLGVKIALTAIPVALKQDSSSPPFVFNAGWVSMLDTNGFIEEVRAHAATQMWFPRIASDATLVGYSFPAGVVATITEVLREP